MATPIYNSDLPMTFIHSGVSRIFQRNQQLLRKGGGGQLTYYLTIFSRKLHENEEILALVRPTSAIFLHELFAIIGEVVKFGNTHIYMFKTTLTCLLIGSKQKFGNM